jgi:hypothetical protein
MGLMKQVHYSCLSSAPFAEAAAFHQGKNRRRATSKIA